jgi:hypothetical protein
MKGQRTPDRDAGLALGRHRKRLSTLSTHTHAGERSSAHHLVDRVGDIAVQTGAATVGALVIALGLRATDQRVCQ